MTRNLGYGGSKHLYIYKLLPWKQFLEVCMYSACCQDKYFGGEIWKYFCFHGYKDESSQHILEARVEGMGWGGLASVAV